MHTIDIRDAEAQLDEFVERAARGEVFVIAKDGKPLVKMMRVDPPPRLGFLKGEIQVPDDFDRIEIDF